MSASVRECGSGLRARLRRVLAVAAFALPLGGCGAGCADEVVQHEPSPYGRGAAIVFVRDCGNGMPPTTQVSIVGHVDAPPRERNVVFAANDNDGAAESVPGEGLRVRVRWIDGNRLEIAHHPRARTFRRETEHGPLRITYATLPQPSE